MIPPRSSTTRHRGSRGRALLLVAALCLPALVDAQTTGAAITAADLRRRLFLVADDSMGGRATGSRGNYQSAEYIAREFKRLGLRPAGDDGTYFQTVPFFRLRADSASQLMAGAATLQMGRDVIVALVRSIPRPLDGKRVVYGGALDDSSSWISADSARDRVVVLSAPPGATFRTTFLLNQTRRFQEAVTVAVPILESFPPELAASQQAGRVTIDTTRTASAPGRLFITTAAAERFLGRPLAGTAPGTLGEVMHGAGTVSYQPLPYAARNVVAVLPGSDPRRSGTYVSLTSHNDHVGFDSAPVDHDSLRALQRVTRPLGADSPAREPTTAEWASIRATLDSLRRLRPPRLDSIRNGADDDGSGTVVMLEIAEALASARVRPARSVLFVSHAAEEEGLLGSRWFTDHPTVPRDSIVSEFDMDMVARGNAIDLAEGSPTYLELIGSRRLSREYGALIDAANARQPLPFTFNLTYDQPGHPLQYYCRADHYSYARYDIPAAVISRGEHADYHQVTDEAQYADFDLMVRVGHFAKAVVEAVANLDHRPLVDVPRRNPNAPCVQ
ncbi:MAG: M28 family peptidase [Gemmatimonadetes bacterium]|nr:M28 family peptidase [Gemmatimonadota bacterium]